MTQVVDGAPISGPFPLAPPNIGTAPFPLPHVGGVTNGEGELLEAWRQLERQQIEFAAFRDREAACLRTERAALDQERAAWIAWRDPCEAKLMEREQNERERADERERRLEAAAAALETRAKQIDVERQHLHSLRQSLRSERHRLDDEKRREWVRAARMSRRLRALAEDAEDRRRKAEIRIRELDRADRWHREQVLLREAELSGLDERIAAARQRMEGSATTLPCRCQSSERVMLEDQTVASLEALYVELNQAADALLQFSEHVALRAPEQIGAGGAGRLAVHPENVEKRRSSRERPEDLAERLRRETAERALRERVELESAELARRQQLVEDELVRQIAAFEQANRSLDEEARAMQNGRTQLTGMLHQIGAMHAALQTLGSEYWHGSTLLWQQWSIVEKLRSELAGHPQAKTVIDRRLHAVVPEIERRRVAFHRSLKEERIRLEAILLGWKRELERTEALTARVESGELHKRLEFIRTRLELERARNLADHWKEQLLSERARQDATRKILEATVEALAAALLDQTICESPRVTGLLREAA